MPFFTPYPGSHLRHNIFSLYDQHTSLEAGPVGQFEKSRIQILCRRPTVMRFQLFYSVMPGSCWYSTVKRAVPPIRGGKGKSVQIPGPCGLLQSPTSEYVARVLIFSRSALAGSPKNCFTEARTRSRQP
jgi:hypothetical protein